MAWKLRKDKLKTDEPDAPMQAAPGMAPEPTLPVAELGAHAAPADDLQFTDDDNEDFLEQLKRLSEPLEAMPFAPDAEPMAMGGEPIAMPPVEAEPVAMEPLRLEAEPITMGAFAPYQPPVTPDAAFAPEPLSEFDPVVAPSAPDPEPEAIAIAPPVAEPEPPVEAPEPVAPEVMSAPAFDVSPEREAVAAGLVTTETESGVPKVAPFILDTPALGAPEAEETARIHNIVLRLGNLSATYFLVKEVTTIGRPDSAVQNYPDIEVELDDGVSRKHAEIRRQERQYVLVDVGSTNGTILNGEMLPEEQPVPLRPGDRIRIGERTEMLFE